MFVPLKPYTATRRMIDAFGGYNTSKGAKSYEFKEMGNMSSIYYPYATCRPRRGLVNTLTKANGLGAMNKLYYADGTSFIYDGTSKGSLTDNEKLFVNSGADVLIFPDKKRYNTSTSAFTNLETSYSQSSTLSILLSKSDGTVYGAYTVSSIPPSSPANGDIWIDTSGDYDIMKQYSSESELWVTLSTTYIKLASTGINTGFSQYDGITISGCTENSINGDYIIRAIGIDYIVVYGLLRSTITQESGITISRSVPAMDYVTEYNNRIWGCSNTNHEIYASKLGDPTNWHCFEGISTDSYAATVASAGDFTGAITYNGYVMFFKENSIHKVYGSKPANYEVTEFKQLGVQSGSSKSLAVVNGVLFYKSINGIMAYSGGQPDIISDKLGDLDGYTDAVACGFGDRYYISMKKNNVWKLFVYDTRKNLWHIEDDIQISYAAFYNDEMYFITNNKLYTVNGTAGTLEETLEWIFITPDFGMESPDQKYITRIQLRIEAGFASVFERIPETVIFADIQYDSDGIWRNMAIVKSSVKRSYNIQIPVRRCDHFSIRFKGKGNFILFSMTFESMEGGSYAYS